MFYKKPNDITYTGMAIFIDSHPISIIKDENIENQIFEYLYHLSYMLARQNRYFYTSYDYDNFSIYLASIVFMRLKKSEIKSVLNYLKSILYFKKVEYEQQNYSQTLSKEEEYIPENLFSQKLNDSTKLLDNIDFYTSLENITVSIKTFLKRIPYKYGSPIWNNIYISCLLTFLDQITINNKDTARLNTKRTDDYLDKLEQGFISKEQKNTKAILFHLDESMNDYIILLIRLIKQFIADSLSYNYKTTINYSDVYDIAQQDINSLDWGDYYE